MKKEIRDLAAIVKHGIEKRGYFLLMNGRLDRLGFNYTEEEKSEIIRKVSKRLNLKTVPQSGAVLFVESISEESDGFSLAQIWSRGY